MFINNNRYVNDLPPLLEEGVRILIYAGDAGNSIVLFNIKLRIDYICNWMGNKAWTLKLDWYGNDGFNAAKDIEFKSKSTGKALGQLRSHENFAFLRGILK